RTECRHQPNCINWLHVEVKRLAGGRFYCDLRWLPLAVLASAAGSPRVRQLGCPMRWDIRNRVGFDLGLLHFSRASALPRTRGFASYALPAPDSQSYIPLTT